jgi:tetratricopeptide (TPR) repeat protein
MNRIGRIKRVVTAWAFAALAPACWAGPAEQVFEGAWDWHLPPRKYGKLSQSERVQFGRAETLIRDGQYEAAALEFEKFVTAWPKTDAYAHALLLQGYSYQLGRFRNKAIERYNEVLDFFADTPDAAVPAGFLKGMSLIQNGNLEQGYAVFQEMTDKDNNLQNPLSDLALVKLADYYMSLNDSKKAETCWRRVIEAFQNDFYGRTDATAVASRQRLVDLFCRDGRFADVDDLLAQYPLDGKKKPDNLNFAVDRGLAVFDTLTPKARKGLFGWLRERKDDYAAEQREPEWFSRLLTVAVKADLRSEWASCASEALAFLKSRSGTAPVSAMAAMLSGRLSDAENAGFKAAGEWKGFGEAMTAQLGKLDAAGQLNGALAVLNSFSARMAAGSDAEVIYSSMIARCRDLYVKMMNPEKDNGLASLSDRLRNVRQFDRAMEVIARIETPPLALWKEIEVLGAREQYVPQAAKCEELEKLDDKGYSMHTLRLRAQIYKDRLAKYEEAVKLYAMINDPPGTIWATSECYERWRKPENAVNALSEIEGFFEKDAPQAALRKAEIWERAGDKTKAIAALRAVLKKYPKAGAASQAHQMLERYGVATGGGVIDED